ncbi:MULTISPECIES: transglutaminase family protein [Silvimonas]|uniref:transglutaminase family protein n=1 Tax=Silvimonas TaxID=300264 RepID=UPI0024B385DF|nr:MULTISPECIES: transglutaminase family protein [Silvimonas]MDR3426726.1 transglutaminase family protein [Silvimonas sp.]
MHLEIHHETVYCYDVPLKHSVQLLRLTPRRDASQNTLYWHLDIPGPTDLAVDAFGNEQHVLTLDQPVSEIRIVAQGVVETRNSAPARDTVPPLVFRQQTALTTADDTIKNFAEKYRRLIEKHGRQGLMDLMADLLDHMPYTPGQTDAGTSAQQAFAQGLGVCQDHAHVFIAICRYLGIPARYVSGYLYTENDHHVASHAWVEALCDELWYGFDVSNACKPDERYVRLAIGLDYLDACPVRGLRRGGGMETMVSRARVRRSTAHEQQ